MWIVGEMPAIDVPGTGGGPDDLPIDGLALLDLDLAGKKESRLLAKVGLTAARCGRGSMPLRPRIQKFGGNASPYGQQTMLTCFLPACVIRPIPPTQQIYHYPTLSCSPKDSPKHAG